MRIVNIMISPSSSPFGTEMAGYKYTNLFLEKNHDVLFIHRNNYDKKYIQKNHKNLTLFKMKNKSILSTLKTRFFIKKWKPDVIIVHHYFSQMRFLGLRIAPMIGVAHMNKFKTMKNYEGVVSLREDSIKQAIEQGVEKTRITVIPNTCNLEGKVKKKKWEKVPIIGAIGCLSPNKNFRTFIKALGILNRKKIPFKAVLAGDGDRKKYLKNLVKKEGINTKFKFLGFVKNPKNFYEEIDVFCVPSIVESFGLVLIEAMFMKKPIVASSIASFKQILTKKTGLLSETLSPESFAKNLEWMLKNKTKAVKMGELARKRYDENYSSDIVYKKLIKLIKKVKK